MSKKRDFFKKYHIKKYQSKRYSNPYFKQGGKPSIWTKWPFMLGGVAIVTAIVLFLWLPVFAVESVEISGTEHVSADDIKQFTEGKLSKNKFLVLPGNNWLLNDEDKFAEAIIEKFVVESAKIEITKGTMHINIKEKISSVVWKTNDRVHFTDLQGIVIREIPEGERESMPDYPLIIDESNTSIMIGQTILNNNVIQAIIDIVELTGQGSIDIVHFKVSSSDANWITATTGPGYDVLFDPDGNIEEQVNNLIVVLRESVGDPSTIQYIDLRFGDHIYYK